MGLFCCFERSCSLVTDIAVQPFNRSATVIAAGLVAHRLIGSGVIDMGRFPPGTFFLASAPCTMRLYLITWHQRLLPHFGLNSSPSHSLSAPAPGRR